MIVYENLQQNTSQWKQLRAGIPTASCFSEIMTPSKAKSTSQESYTNHLLAERMLGYPIDGYQSQDMADGNKFESNAVAAFEFQNDVNTRRIGFVTSDDGRVGCSPDRFVDEWPKEAVEVKAPGNPAIHVSYLRSSTGAMKKYVTQLQGQIWLCELDAVRIISYFAGLPDAVFRVERDDEFITALSEKVREFSDKLENLAADFTARGWIKPKAPESAEEAKDRVFSATFINDEDRAWALSRSYPTEEKE